MTKMEQKKRQKFVDIYFNDNNKTFWNKKKTNRLIDWLIVFFNGKKKSYHLLCINKGNFNFNFYQKENYFLILLLFVFCFLLFAAFFSWTNRVREKSKTKKFTGIQVRILFCSLFYLIINKKFVNKLLNTHTQTHTHEIVNKNTQSKKEWKFI